MNFSASTAPTPVYYLPGRDKPVGDQIGQAIASRGFDVIGRDLLPNFIEYRISRQIELIQRDMDIYCHSPGSVLVARSYGAFLLLQALLCQPPFHGRVLLISPVLGPAKVEPGKAMIMFRPPRANKILDAARKGNFPAPEYMEIQTGADDWVCDLSLAEDFAALVDHTKLNVIENAGHSLDQRVIDKILDDFLKR